MVPEDRLTVVTQAYYANYALGLPQIFFSSELISLQFLVLWCLLSPFRFPCGLSLHQLELSYLGVHHHKCWECSHGRHMCLLVLVLGHNRNTASTHTPLLQEGCLMLLKQLFCSLLCNMVTFSALGTQQRVI